MEFEKRCQHEWGENNNRLVCSKCNKQKLILKQTNKDILTGVRINGRKYSIRVDKLKYFMPDDWTRFYNNLRDKNKLLFEFLICTGARIEEALCFHSDGLVDDDRKLIKLYVTKRKAKKIGEQSGKPRTFEVSTKLYNRLSRADKGYIFINADRDISMNTNEGRLILKKYTKSKSTVAYLNMKSNLRRTGIKDVYNYSLHSIRKTHGMWLKALEIDMTEICSRLGHNYQTYLEHYGSPSIFQPRDKLLMIKILGDIYGLK